MANLTAGENCGELQVALDIIVGKWKPIILFHLMENEKLRFSELQRAIPEITKKMLTSQLRELEYNDIVHREVYQQVPPKVEYSMTEYGQYKDSEWKRKYVTHGYMRDKKNESFLKVMKAGFLRIKRAARRIKPS